MATQKWNRDAELAAELQDTIEAERLRKAQKRQEPLLRGAPEVRYSPQRMIQRREHTR